MSQKRRKPRQRQGRGVSEFRDYWIYELLGWIEPKAGTGEHNYGHPFLMHVITINGRRKDVPCRLISAAKRITDLRAANDEG